MWDLRKPKVYAKYVKGNAIIVQNAVERLHYGAYHCSGDKNTGEKFVVSAMVHVGGNCVYQ